MDTLPELIKRVMDAIPGMSYRKLAALDPLGGLTHGRIQQLVEDPMRNFPEPRTIVALAAVLRCTQQEVIMAAARSLGLQVVRDPVPSVTDSIVRDPFLLPEAKQHLAVQYGLLRRIQGPSGGPNDEPDPDGPDDAPPTMTDKGGKVADLGIAKDARRRVKERQRGGNGP